MQIIKKSVVRLQQTFDGASMAGVARRLKIPYATVRNYYFDRLPAPEVLIKIANETSMLTARFGRSDTRTFVKFVVLQGFMAPDPKPLVRGGAGIGVKP